MADPAIAKLLDNADHTAVLRPGDTLIIAVNHPIPRAVSQEMGASVREHLGADVKVLVLADVAQLALYRPHPETDR